MVLIPGVRTRLSILPECSKAAPHEVSHADLAYCSKIMTYCQPAGRLPMLEDQCAIQSGLFDPNAALLPVHSFHQLVVVYITNKNINRSVSFIVKQRMQTWVTKYVFKHEDQDTVISQAHRFVAAWYVLEKSLIHETIVA